MPHVTQRSSCPRIGPMVVTKPTFLLRSSIHVAHLLAWCLYMGSFLNGGLLALTLAVHWSSLSLCKEMAALPMGQARERRLVELNVVEIGRAHV